MKYKWKLPIGRYSFLSHTQQARENLTQKNVCELKWCYPEQRCINTYSAAHFCYLSEVKSYNISVDISK